MREGNPSVFVIVSVLNRNRSVKWCEIECCSMLSGRQVLVEGCAFVIVRCTNAWWLQTAKAR